jgi:hypothetical protein
MEDLIVLYIVFKPMILDFYESQLLRIDPQSFKIFQAHHKFRNGYLLPKYDDNT